MKPHFAVEGVWRSFRGRSVLRNAAVWTYPGGITVLLGRNGAGKTTLLRFAVGLVRSDTGIVMLGPERFTRPRLSALATRGLFYLADRDLLTAALPVRAHFDAVAERWGSAAQTAAIDACQVRPLLDRRPVTLSGGERRRIEVALAEARAPTCLLADEPLRGLTPLDALLIGRRLRAQADRGCAVLITGHEVRPLLALADHVVWITAGTTHYLGTPTQARAHHLFRLQYLGTHESLE